MNTIAIILATIIFLAPGLGVYAGLFVMGGRGEFKPAPPRPGSIVTVTIVIFGALLVHSVASCLAFLFIAEPGTEALIKFGFEPNPYKLIALTFSRGSPLEDQSIAYLLCWLAILPVFSLAFVRILSGLLLKHQGMSSFIYGWVEQIARESSPKNNWVVAFVLTEDHIQDTVLGYEGVVRELTLDAEKQVTSITLVDVERFLVSKRQNSFRRQKPLSTNPKIGNLHIPGTKIANIAFTIFSVEEE